MGADQVAELSSWRRPEEIGRLATVLAFGRAGGDADAPEAPVPVRFVPTTRLDISASLVRRRIAHRQSIRYMVPEAVLSIIEREQLYRSGGDGPGPTGPQ
jgi:nicotinate-nucleotide adenylyltransferase